MSNKMFEPKMVAKASSAAEGLCKWIRAMVLYYQVLKIVAPKKEKLAAAEKEYSDTMELLNEKRRALAALNQKLANLNRKLQETMATKIRLQKEVVQSIRNFLVRTFFNDKIKNAGDSVQEQIDSRREADQGTRR